MRIVLIASLFKKYIHRVVSAVSRRRVALSNRTMCPSPACCVILRPIWPWSRYSDREDDICLQCDIGSLSTDLRNLRSHCVGALFILSLLLGTATGNVVSDAFRDFVLSVRFRNQRWCISLQPVALIVHEGTACNHLVQDRRLRFLDGRKFRAAFGKLLLYELLVALKVLLAALKVHGLIGEEFGVLVDSFPIARPEFFFGRPGSIQVKLKAFCSLALHVDMQPAVHNFCANEAGEMCSMKNPRV
jgi:hypothetical protein